MANYTKIYWRSSGVPTWGLVFLTIAALSAFLLAEKLQQRDPVVEENYTTMVTAARIMRDAMDTLQPIRAQREPINPEFDPQRSGLIGVSTSPVTTTRGGRESKQTTINPNWAAVAVKLMKQAGVEQGDKVAVTVSGSFPAMNLAVYSAIEAIGAEPVIIASASSSQWGANVPGLLWIDMERELRQRGKLSLKPIAVSIGGVEDRGVDLSAEGIALIKQSIDRADIPLLEPQDYQEAVAERVALFREYAEGEKYKAFINVGGGATIVGPPGIDDQFKSGLIYDAPARAFAVETVMGHFIREGTPGIHMIGIKGLAERYNLPLAPLEPVAVGNGGVYNATTYRRWLAAVLGLGLFGLTWLIVRSARINSVFQRTGEDGKSVRPMV
ncbi:MULTISPECIES: poly-gamma-glutamate system protein [Idiomarina]|uniref:poly-gamma-glutamate system protein n=1 Tax=Idiomarina TaxID=135575 RepID=UPI00129C7066|nr:MULTISPECIES: poly-gamma-glutamate system protein [Idiomarina]MRJ41900.1 poly-gamma-glutamate system protein [Idiomarina sp. FeN1]NCU57183.1 poly-gamma-glutamate system protein [Idiomarina sp. FenA--70]NCU59892.1 poly-gamma-glutamate system protein [Idiomarina sp. FenBw--71]UUN12812.1 poly-gamma-glutamate system protein [Idiomarina loihiensis]